MTCRSGTRDRRSGRVAERIHARRGQTGVWLLGPAVLALLLSGPASAEPADEPDPDLRRLERKLDAAVATVEALRDELEALKARRQEAPRSVAGGGMAPVAMPGAPLPKLDASPIVADPSDATPALYRPDRGQTVLLTANGTDGLLEQEEVSTEQEDPILQPGALRQARAVLIGAGRLEIEPSFTFRHRHRNRLALRGLDLIENIFIGNVEVQRVRRSTLTTAVSARLGITDRLQLNLAVPYSYVFNQTLLLPEVQRELGEEVETTADSGDIGDLDIGFSYHLLQEGQRFEWLPVDVIASVSLKTDTGQSPFEADPDEFSTGTGFFGVRSGLTMVKVLDPAALFATVSYFYHIPSSRNVGAFDRVNPPDDVAWSAGFSWAMNPSLSLSTRVENRFIQKTEIDGLTIDGSDQITASLVTGLTLRTSRRTSVDLSASVGLTDDSPDFAFRMSIPLSFRTPWNLERMMRDLASGDWKW